LKGFELIKYAFIIVEQACLMSNVGMPIMVLNNAYYSYLLGGKTLTVPNGATPIVLFTGEKYANDKKYVNKGNKYKYFPFSVLNLVSKVMTELMVPFNRVQISEEEFVLIRAIIYANMVTNGLSPEAQEILLEEAQKYSKMLMRMLQVKMKNANNYLFPPLNRIGTDQLAGRENMQNCCSLWSSATTMPTTMWNSSITW
jgi:hypothetical protein